MTGAPKTILELLKTIAGWNNEEIQQAFGRNGCLPSPGGHDSA